MRAHVDAALASQVHTDAVASVMDDLHPKLAAATETILRRYVRSAVAAFVRQHDIVHVRAAGAQEPASWRFPLQGDLVDGEALNADLSVPTVRYGTEAIRATGAAFSLGLAMNQDFSNKLLDGVIATQSGMKITTAAADLVAPMMTSLQASYDAGASIPNAARGMRDAGYAQSQAFGQRIARTELTSATNGASLALASAGTDLGYKLWIATADDRTRDSHMEADGQIVPIDEAFSVGGDELEFPGDPDGSPDEVINCRCTIGYASSADGGDTSSGGGEGTGGGGVPSTWGEAPYDEMSHEMDVRGDSAVSAGQEIRDRMEAESPGIEYLQESQRSDEQQVLANGLKAMNEYTGPNGEMLNLTLRDPGGLGADPFDMAGMAKDMQYLYHVDGLHATLKEDTILYRGMTEVPKDWIMPGTEVTDLGFTSTSIDSEVAWKFAGEGDTPMSHDSANVILRMHAPAGTKYIIGFDGESEVILNAGTHYIVVSEASQQFGVGSTTYDAIVLKPGETAVDKLAALRKAAK